MSTSNPWLTPLQRSYDTIKAKIVAKMKTNTPEITDFSEGNIFMILTSIFAAIAEVLHYYIDNMARESFLSTARRYSSVYKHAKLVDYHIKSAIASSVDLTLYRSSGEALSADISIPVNTEFTSTDGKTWVSYATTVWSAGTYSVKVSVVQKEPISDSGTISIGSITSQDITVSIGTLPTDKLYLEGSMVLYIDSEPWELVETFAYSTYNDKVYKVEVDQTLSPQIIFGDGTFGEKPPLGGVITGSYYVTYGADGNLAAGSFTEVPSLLTDIESDITLTNTTSAAGGSNYEDFNSLKDHIPLSVKTLGVAITKEDFEAVAKLVSGVDKAYVNYICGKYIEIYVTPDGGGIASEALLSEVAAKVSSSKVVTTNVHITSTYTAQIYIKATITGRKSFASDDISDQVLSAITDNYSYSNTEINQVIRISDLYYIMESQSMVDYLTIDSLFMLSYPVPIDNSLSYNPPELVITNFDQEYFSKINGSTYETLKVVIKSSGYSILDGAGIHTLASSTYGTTCSVEFIPNSSIPTTLTSSFKFSITIGSSESGISYNVGDSYYLYIQEMGTDLTPMNYNIPIAESSNITLTINEVV